MTVQELISSLSPERLSREFAYVRYSGPSRLILPAMGRGLIDSLNVPNYGAVTTGAELYVHNADFDKFVRRGWVEAIDSPLAVVKETLAVTPEPTKSSGEAGNPTGNETEGTANDDIASEGSDSGSGEISTANGDEEISTASADNKDITDD